ncbi:hypothetical protein [Microcoleus sp. S13C4]
MVIRPVPPEAHGEIDCIALKYRKIASEPHSIVTTKALNKVVAPTILYIQ